MKQRSDASRSGGSEKVLRAACQKGVTAVQYSKNKCTQQFSGDIIREWHVALIQKGSKKHSFKYNK